MEIKELLKSKEELENSISEFVAEQLKSFTEETGVQIRSVYLSLNDIMELSKKEPVMTFVKTDIHLAI